MHTDDIVRVAREELDGKYFFLFHRDNIFLYPKNRISSRLGEEFKRIADVDIRRNSLTGIRIVITEHKPAYLWCGDDMPEERIHPS